jgi:hypothetical protein
MTSVQEQDIKHYLATGDYDFSPSDWPGGWADGAKSNYMMQQALIAEVKRRTQGLHVPAIPVLDLHSFTRHKVAPMVNGLFPENERANVLKILEKSVVFLTPNSIAEAICSTSWLHTSWALANLYLLSMGVELLGDTAERIVGLSAETTCYVSYEYFTKQDQDRFADFVVHEAAHIFHNCKRYTAGLPETRTREFLLNIDFSQRETFAYACEVYSRILEMADNRIGRLKLLAKAKREFVPPCDRVDIEKFWAALSAAASARNGWKQILQICAPPKRATNMLKTGYESLIGSSK